MKVDAAHWIYPEVDEDHSVQTDEWQYYLSHNVYKEIRGDRRFPKERLENRVYYAVQNLSAAELALYGIIKIKRLKQ